MTAAPWRAEVAAQAAERGVELDEARWAALERFVRMVLDYNRRANLTAAKDEGELARRHVADALSALPLLRLCLEGTAEPKIADVGSGGGLVGIPLQVAWPEARFWLVESVHRKFLFLNWASVELRLPARALQVRAGGHAPPAWGPAGGFDAAVARALAPIEEALELCVPLLKPGGCFVAFRSEPELSDKARLALERLGAAPYRSEDYRLPGETKARWLTAFRKEA